MYVHLKQHVYMIRFIHSLLSDELTDANHKFELMRAKISEFKTNISESKEKTQEYGTFVVYVHVY